MGRHVVFHEDAWTSFGGQYNQFIVAGAIDIPDEGVPITWQFDHSKPPIGKASNFRREEDGVTVTAELEFNDDWKDKIAAVSQDVGAAFFADKAEFFKIEDLDVITAGKLRHVAITLGLPWTLTEGKV